MITKEANALPKLKALLEADENVDASELSFYAAQVDTQGLQTSLEDC